MKKRIIKERNRKKNSETQMAVRSHCATLSLLLQPVSSFFTNFRVFVSVVTKVRGIRLLTQTTQEQKHTLQNGSTSERALSIPPPTPTTHFESRASFGGLGISLATWRSKVPRRLVGPAVGAVTTASRLAAACCLLSPSSAPWTALRWPGIDFGRAQIDALG